CGSGILLNRLLESSLIFKGFSRLSTCLSALPLALSMEAHYRDLDHACKGVFELNSHFWFNRSLITQKAHLSCNNTPVWRARYPLDGVAVVADQGCGDLVSLHLYAW
ncbi:hypothetical protein, partial [Aeromonas veronii]|uniref:hypothetical protein n=1 Tax=Aeromonas veronii TaxID=654 RepID=UPI003D1DF1D1